MNVILSSHYETVATAFQVADIADPLHTSAPPDWTVEDVLTAILEGQIEEPANWFCLIRDDEKIYGYIALDFATEEDVEHRDEVAQAPAVDHCTLITPDQIVPGSMPLLDLIPLFQQHFFFFALTRNEVTHVVSFLDLDKLPVKLCLFSLVMALEAELINLFSSKLDAIENYLRLLPEGRFQKARDLGQTKYKNGRVTSEQILLCTTFIDKATILVRSPELVNALPFESKRHTEHFFNRAQDLRNQIAHSDSILKVLRTPEEFDGFVSELKKITEAISKLRRINS